MPSYEPDLRHEQAGPTEPGKFFLKNRANVPAAQHLARKAPKKAMPCPLREIRFGAHNTFIDLDQRCAMPLRALRLRLDPAAGLTVAAQSFGLELAIDLALAELSIAI